MKTSTLRFCAVLLLAAGAGQLAHAQVITDPYVERGLRYGVRSWEGEPWSQRYNYSLTNSFIFLNGDSRQLYYLDYLDKADRARKFGYRMPVDPFFGPAPEEVHGVPVDGQVMVAPNGVPVDGPVTIAPPNRVYFGGGLGWFRRR